MGTWLTTAWGRNSGSSKPSASLSQLVSLWWQGLSLHLMCVWVLLFICTNEKNKIRLSYLGAVRPFAFVLSTVHIRTFACCDDLLQLGIMIIITTFNLISLGLPSKQQHSSLMRLLLAWKKVLPPPHYCGCRRGQVGLRRSCLAPRGCWWPPSTQRRWSSRWRRWPSGWRRSRWRQAPSPHHLPHHPLAKPPETLHWTNILLGWVNNVNRW